MADVWARQPDEPNRWYDRFETFRLLGPDRSLDGAYRVHSGKAGRAGSAWRQAAGRWQWGDRAEAWDEAEREQLRREEAERRRQARERRLSILGEVREQSWTAIQDALANWRRMESGETTPSMLNSLRQMLIEGMKLERLEYGEVTEVVQEREERPMTADELAKALDELDEWQRMKAGGGNG